MAQQQSTEQISCVKCGCEFSPQRISCPSCGMPVAKEKTHSSSRFVKYFVALVIFCALVILIAPR